MTCSFNANTSDLIISYSRSERTLTVHSRSARLISSVFSGVEVFISLGSSSGLEASLSINTCSFGNAEISSSLQSPNMESTKSFLQIFSAKVQMSTFLSAARKRKATRIFSSFSLAPQKTILSFIYTINQQVLR